MGPALADLDLGPLIRQNQQQRVWDFLSEAQRDGIPMVAQGHVDDDAPRPASTRRRPCCATCRRAIGSPRTRSSARCSSPCRSTTRTRRIALANGTHYGLVAGVWTRDGARQMRIARRLRSGQVFVNNYGAGGGVELPFGGVKSSGYGREKGFEALLGFTTLKTIAIRHG